MTASASPSKTILIRGGRLHDPKANVAGEIRDVWLRDGKVIPPPVTGEGTANDTACRTHTPDRVIDAKGMRVTPGAVEVHAHIASTTVNAARGIQSGAGYHAVVPPTVDTGRQYATLGYTAAIEPAVPPATAANAHLQLDRLPNLDAGLLVLFGNHEAVISRLIAGDRAGAIDVVRHLLHATRAYGIKAVNPAAVAIWRRHANRHHIESLDDSLAGAAGTTGKSASKTGLDAITPRAILELLTEAQEQLHLAHPTHIHGPQLGDPNNVAITTELIHALRGRRYHLAHLQYYCYGATEKGAHRGDVDAILKALADQPQATFDLGLVAFGPAFTATADLPLEHALYRATGKTTQPALFNDNENEDCFGVMPLIHSESSGMHALQWAVGMELALKCDDLTRVSLTVDHPNGGSFLNYPALIAQLMSKARRDEQLARCHKHARDRAGLHSESRELSFDDILMLTRVAPARSLGLANKGTLTAGSDADVTIYADRMDDPESMFASPTYVLKAGRVVVDAGKYVADVQPNRLVAEVPATEAGQAHYEAWRLDVGQSALPAIA